MKHAVISVLALLGLMSSALADAGRVEAFKSRFQLVRDERGGLLYVKDASVTPGFSLKPLVDQIIRDFESLKSQPDQVTAAQVDATYDKVPTRWAAKRVLKKAKHVNLRALFNNPALVSVLSGFESKIKQALTLAPDVMAAPQDPSFFYRKAVTYAIMLKALQQAAQAIDNLPVLGVAAYVIEAGERLIRERRYYHQNMLLYFLERFTPAELGMTDQEVARVTSSIYESRLEPMGWLEHTLARDLWEGYGGIKFDAAYKACEERLMQYKNDYEYIGERINFGFLEIREDGVHKIVNLVDARHQFTEKPSVAFYYDDPTGVARKRMLARLVQLGVHFAPFEAQSKQIIDDFIESSFAAQRITEGALMGYFEAHDMKASMKSLAAQSMNPYETFAQ